MVTKVVPIRLEREGGGGGEGRRNHFVDQTKLIISGVRRKFSGRQVN